VYFWDCADILNDNGTQVMSCYFPVSNKDSSIGILKIYSIEAIVTRSQLSIQKKGKHVAEDSINAK
jgi:hypothetical protein